jgi:hypothetical protein
MIEQLILCGLALGQVAVGGEPPEHVKKYLKRCEESKVAAVRIPLPPARGDVGVLVTEAAGGGAARQTVDVLEVIDGDEAIVRAWFLPAGAAADDEATFVDVWVQGVETAGLVVGPNAKLPQVFHVTGNKLIATTCGSRSFALLEPIDISRWRGAQQK